MRRSRRPIPLKLISVVAALVPALGLEIVQRRRLALVLQVNGATQHVAAETLRVSPRTIAYDLRYCREHRVVDLISDDAATVIGESLALFEEVRVLALLEHAKLLADPDGSGPSGVRARLLCFSTAVAAERARVRLLQHAGLLPRCTRRRRRSRMKLPSLPFVAA